MPNRPRPEAGPPRLVAPRTPRPGGQPRLADALFGVGAAILVLVTVAVLILLALLVLGLVRPH